MEVHPSTKGHVVDQLGQAEFALKVASNFACLKGTPAHESVRTALAQIGQARAWIDASLREACPSVGPVLPAYESVAERRRIVQRRMARLAP